MSDIAQALTGSLARDGRGGMLGPVNMNGNGITGLPYGVEPSDAAVVGQLVATVGPTGPAANTFTSLASLKAIDPAIYPSAVLVDGANPAVLYAYVLGSFTGRTDVVFLNSDPTGAIGALVQQPLLSYISDVRATLARLQGGSPIAGASQIRGIAGNIVAAASIVTTDGLNVRLYRPDGSGAYSTIYIRDYVMSATQVPGFYAASDLYAGFNWYAAKVNQTTWEVPDSIDAAGNPVFKPGGGTYGSRASLDGNPFLVQWAWNHYQKSGTPRLFNEKQAFLRGLLDHLPYDATTKGVVSVAGNECVGFGFIDSWKLNGTLTYVSMLTYRSWLMYADMAFAANNYVEASYGIARANAMKLAFNDPTKGMFVNAGSLNTGPNGLFRFSNGSIAPNVLDIWGSAEAVLCGFATTETAFAIATSLVSNLGNDGNGIPIYLARGGVRHAYTNNDFAPGSKVLDASWTGNSLYGTYQNGAYWATPLKAVVHTLALVRPDVALSVVRDVLREINVETQRDAAVAGSSTYGTTAAGIAAVPDGAYFKVGSQAYERQGAGAATVQTVILGAEWVSRDPKVGEGGVPLYGNGQYMVSAAAWLGVDSKNVRAIQQTTKLTVPTGGTAQVIPANTWTKVNFTTPISDQIGTRNVNPESPYLVSNGGIQFLYPCDVDVWAQLRFAGVATVIPGEILMAIYLQPLGGAPALEDILFDDIIPTDSNFSLGSTPRSFNNIAPGTTAYIYVKCPAQALNIQDVGGDNARYSVFTARVTGEAQAV